uniref:Transcription factor MYB98 n=1 Tax=Anthurium amnicola TaxID=1678845 RepID=A0A1D1ZBB5_9ARAE
MDLEAVPSTAEERARRSRDNVDALEEERRLLQVLQRTFPLSLHLVTQTIENYRQQIAEPAPASAWREEEKKVFDESLMEYTHRSKQTWAAIALRIPGKTPSMWRRTTGGSCWTSSTRRQCDRVLR